MALPRDQETAGPIRPSVYRPELDVLRFAAFLLVFVHHVLPRDPVDWPAAWAPAARTIAVALANTCGYGLSLFFFLSAFLITDLLLREKSRTEDVRLRSFYVRRILRIWPLYGLGLMIGIALALFGGNRRDLVMFAMYAVMAGNWFFMCGAWPRNPATPLWSISIEEQFYLFWPLVIKRLDRRGIYMACAVLVFTAVLAEICLGRVHAAIDTTVWTNSFVQFETFAIGAAVALALGGVAPRLSMWRRGSLMATGSGLWFLSVDACAAKTTGVVSSTPMLVTGTFMAALGTLAIFLSILGAEVARRSVWVYLGKISFGLYVYHLLFIEVAKVEASGFVDPRVGLLCQLLSIVQTILVAAFSYRYLEAPFLRLKDRFTMVTSRPPELSVPRSTWPLLTPHAFSRKPKPL